MIRFLTNRDSNNYGNYEDSGIATSADAHSLEYDDMPPDACHSPAHAHINHVGPLPHFKGPASRISSISTSTRSQTIQQHYYPEGEFGWIILFVGTVVAILCQGLQLACGVLIFATMTRFDSVSVTDAGKS